MRYSARGGAKDEVEMEKVKVLVAQSCPTLCNTMGSSPWDFPSKNTGVGYHFLLQGIILTQGSKPHLLLLLHCRQILYH